MLIYIRARQNKKVHTLSDQVFLILQKKNERYTKIEFTLQSETELTSSYCVFYSDGFKL